MDGVIKKNIFLLRWIFLAICYFFYASASAASESYPIRIDSIADKAIASANLKIAKNTIDRSQNTLQVHAPVFVFVDTFIDNYQTLVKDIQDHNLNQNIHIVYLNPDHNGIQQITDTLANQTGIAAIHLLTHGIAGSVQLGNAALNQNTIDLYRDNLSAWKKSLSANADILIYGCNVTSTDAGLQLIQQIGDLTQAHVAASQNVTGNISFGADWNLESHYGEVKTNVIISAQTQQSWDSILAYSNYISIGPGGVDQAFRDNSNVGTSFSYDSPGATYSVNRVTVQLKILAGADTSQNITLCLRNTWNGANITSASMATSVLTTSYAWYAFNFPSAVNLNDNQVYYIQIYTLSTDLKTVANTWNSSQWNSNTELYVGVTAYPSKELTFILSTGTNTAPVVNSAIPDQTGTVNTAFNYTVSASAFTDADTGDRLTYSATLSSGAALPGWLSFNTSTRAFSGTPTSGGTISVKVTASDGTASANDTFDIVINTPPVVNSAIPDQTASDGVAFSFQFASNAFTDADGNTLTYSATLSSGAALPAWLSFSAATRTFSGTPGSGDIGTISVKVTASDGSASVNDTFDIVISSGVHHYGIVPLTGSGTTCEGLQITITAYNSGGTAIAPANGTTLTLSTSPATGTWVGGSTAAFDGVSTSVTKYLQQTTASTLNINVTDGTHSESASIDPNIVFNGSSLAFYGSSGLIALPNQVSGTTDSAPIVKVSCTSRVSGTVSVGMAYECRNPTTCVSGQSFKFAAQGVTPNNNGAAISYSTGKTLTFDGSGVAPLSLNYNDVGLVRLHARIVLTASGNDPAITLTATSTEFVVKPHTLVATAITTSGGVANPAGSSTSGTAAQFVPAGTAFKVYVESRNGAGTKTPNFGNETTSENNLKFVAQSLVYPSGGTLTALTGASTFTSTATPSTGEFLDSSVVWDQVGSFTARPELADNDYLGAGDVPNKTVTGTIGRFYPDHFSLASSSTTNSCAAGGFSFLSQPAIGLNYVLQAKSSANTTVTNYGSGYGAAQATVSYVAENSNGADGATFSSRLSDGAAPAWVSGVMTVASTTASVSRQLTTFAPDGPFNSLQWGLDLTESFDGGRSLSGKDMNALTTGTCSGGTCTAIAIGSPLVLRYGRLRLDSASGPETARLPVNFLSEYWVGNYFSLNSNDSCTIVPLAAITYPNGTLATAANFNVPLSSGTTTGTYTNPTGGVHFNAGTAGHFFSQPSVGGTGTFVVGINLSTLTWLRYDWNQDGTYSDTSIPNATYAFGTYRGNDRIVYWHERLQ